MDTLTLLYLTFRFMLGLAGVPSIVMFLGFLFMPESPRWLVFHGHTERARHVLRKIHHQDTVNAELANIVRDHEEHRRLKLSKELAVNYSEAHSTGDTNPSPVAQEVFSSTKLLCVCLCVCTGVRSLVVKFCTSRSVQLALFVGCGLQLFQQFGGINTVM